MNCEERLKWFRDSRFGMFLHWGLYSLLGRNEWAFRLDCYSVKEYAKLAEQFVPERFDADKWASVAAEAGMKYMVLTTRHHDGFCLYDSKVSDFTSVKSAAKRDFVAEYVNACRKAGLKVGLYYSLMDWRYRGCFDPEKYPESANAMIQQAHDQVRELLTEYGKIDLLWYDGENLPDYRLQDKELQRALSRSLWKSEELNAMARSLQPHIIINNRNGTEGDFVTPEKRIEAARDGLMWESCLTLNPLSWSHVPYSSCTKSAAQIVRDMIEIAAGGGNLLLNTGPKPDGSLNPEEEVKILEAGGWIKRNAEAIYGSRPSALDSDAHGPSGCLGRWIGSDDPTVHYLAALGWYGSEFWSVRVDGEIESVTALATGKPIDFRREKHGRLILQNLPSAPIDPYATVFRVQFSAPPRILELPPRAGMIESEM